jgi:hypothetical protein
MRGISTYAWVCLFCGCSTTPSVVYEGGPDGGAADGTVGDSSTGDVGANDGPGGQDAGGDTAVPPGDSGGEASIVDAGPDTAWNTCPGTPPANLKCCDTTACSGPCMTSQCAECADAGCTPNQICCTSGSGPATHCVNHGSAC